MKELSANADGRASAAQSSKSKVKSRQSQPNLLGGAASKPSVPSLPSIQRTSTQPANAAHHSSGPRLPMQKSPSSSGNPSSAPRLGISNKTASGPQLANMSMRMQAGPAVAAPGKSNAVVFVLVGVLVAAIVVLAYLVLAK
jgi:hypothetical protein